MASKSLKAKTTRRAAKPAAQTAKPAKPSMDDIYAAYSSLCGLIHVVVNLDHSDTDIQSSLYSLERLADRLLEDFFHAHTGKTYAEVAAEQAARLGGVS